jgi:hypothetical protein
MKRLLWFAVIALGGCPAPARYVVADVTAARVPVEGAVVAAECGQYKNAAQRTDDLGRARLRVAEGADYCSLVVAKPGYETVETGPVNMCPTAAACQPTRIDFVSERAEYVRPVPMPMPPYAQPPMHRPVPAIGNEVAQ